MPQHRPIKFTATLESSLKRELVKIIKEKYEASSAMKIALAIAASGGILTLGVAAPGVLAGVGQFLKWERKRKREEYRLIWRNFHRLKQQRAVEFVKEEGNYLYYRLTTKGKQKIEKFIFDELFISQSKRWDKKWRLVIFDIPESKRRARDLLREKLKEMEFYQCQKSAWVHPFDCLREIEFLKDFLEIKSFVKIFVVDEMDDGRVIYHFKDLLKQVS